MRKILTLSMMVVFIIGLKAQTVKILFDATKAETAANSDWVMDADQYNLDWNPGAVIMSGTYEANAQKVPTPAQSGITSTTVETYWSGGISSWAVDMVKKGYYVETLPYNGAITYGNASNIQDLSNYKVFIVCEPNIKFTTAEKNAMLSFVQNGGGLFMVADHNISDRNGDGWDSPHIWNDFMDTNYVITTHPFGIHFDYANFSQTSTNVATLPGDPLLHGIMGNVTKVMWSGGNTMTLSTTNNSSVKGVVFKTGSSTTGSTNAMVAYVTYGTGRVVGFGDSSPCDDGTGDVNDVLYDGWITDASGNHEKLIVNATIWLAGNPATSIDEVVSDNILVNQLTYNDRVEFVISSSETIKNASFNVFDILGNLVYKTSDVAEINLLNNQLGSGIFIYRLDVDEVTSKTGKFIIP